MTTGSQSGSGKIVIEHYDYLKQIWGDSPSTRQLPCGIRSKELNDDQRNSHDSLNGEENDIFSEGNKSTEYDLTDHSTDDSQPAVVFRKRKITQNPAPRLVDNKRKHVERQLSASQRDQVLLNESKEDARFKRDIAEAIRQSNTTFAESMQQMSHSIAEVAHGFSRSAEMLCQAIMQQPIQLNNFQPIQHTKLQNQRGSPAFYHQQTCSTTNHPQRHFSRYQNDQNISGIDNEELLDIEL